MTVGNNYLSEITGVVCNQNATTRLDCGSEVQKIIGSGPVSSAASSAYSALGATWVAFYDTAFAKTFAFSATSPWFR